MKICLSSLKPVKGDMSTLIHQMELTYVSFIFKQCTNLSTLSSAGHSAVLDKSLSAMAATK